MYSNELYLFLYLIYFFFKHPLNQCKRECYFPKTVLWRKRRFSHEDSGPTMLSWVRTAAYPGPRWKEENYKYKKGTILRHPSAMASKARKWATIISFTASRIFFFFIFFQIPLFRYQFYRFFVKSMCWHFNLQLIQRKSLIETLILT